jgi:hypothetical protein
MTPIGWPKGYERRRDVEKRRNKDPVNISSHPDNARTALMRGGHEQRRTNDP